MPAGVAPPGFHGKKGRSGRKSYRDEKLRFQVIEKAWEKKHKRMTDQDATQIVLKDMTIKTDLGGSIKLNIQFDDAFKKINYDAPESSQSTEESGGEQSEV